MANNTQGDAPKMQDYGSPEGGSDSEYQGKHSGGTEGTEQGGEGEKFGEFGNTGSGTDLTIEMENSDVRSGLVKGGEAGAADAGGTGRYGGDDGGVSEESNTDS